MSGSRSAWAWAWASAWAARAVSTRSRLVLSPVKASRRVCRPAPSRSVVSAVMNTVEERGLRDGDIPDLGAPAQDADCSRPVPCRGVERKPVVAGLLHGHGVPRPFGIADVGDGVAPVDGLDVDVVIPVRPALVAGDRVVVGDPLTAVVVVLGLDDPRHDERTGTVPESASVWASASASSRGSGRSGTRAEARRSGCSSSRP